MIPAQPTQPSWMLHLGNTWDLLPSHHEYFLQPGSEQWAKAAWRAGVLELFFFSLYLKNYPLPASRAANKRVPEKKPSFTYLFLILLKDVWCFAALAFLVHQTCASEKLFISSALRTRLPDPRFPCCSPSRFPCLQLALLVCYRADANTALAVGSEAQGVKQAVWGHSPHGTRGRAPGRQKASLGSGNSQRDPSGELPAQLRVWTSHLDLYLCIY